MVQKRLTKIPETTYLSADKAELYRAVMRLLYNEKEMFNSQLSKNEIIEKIRQRSEFTDLTDDELENALKQLTAWGNIVPMQDLREPATIEEYKRKLYRYSISEYAIKIERMTVELENLFSEGNVLSSSLLKRIYGYLLETDKILNSNNLKEINEWWRNLLEDFNRLDQNFSDYVHAFYSANGEKMLHSIDFIRHKDKFVGYLREFIRVLQKYSGDIEKALIEINADKKEELLNKILQSEMEIPRTASEAYDTDIIKDKLYIKWDNLFDWFVSTESKRSRCSTAMEYTDEIIRKILNNAVMLMQLQNLGISRKQDYRQYMRMFAECTDIDEAHCLSAHVFGVMNIAHYKCNSNRETDSIFENAAELKPQFFEIQPRTRVYKPRIKTKGFSDRQLEKAAYRQARLEKIRHEQEIVESYIKDDKISLSELREIVPEELRIAILKWITSANQNSKKSGITDFGRAFRLINPGGNTVLHCVDGDLHMPDYIIEFGEKQQ